VLGRSKRKGKVKELGLWMWDILSKLVRERRKNWKNRDKK